MASHDNRGQLDRSICGLCGDAYFECSKCGVYFCACTRSEACPIPPGRWDDPDPEDPPATRDEDPMWGRDE